MKLRQGDVLFEASEELERVYFPHTLVASMLVMAANGDSVDIATVGCEGMLGPLSAAGRSTSFTRQVVQVSGSTSVMERQTWFRFLEAEPQLRALAATYQDALSVQIMQSVACNALHGSEERFARWLLMMDDRSPGSDIALTHELIGQMLGVRRPTVTLIAGAYQRAGLLTNTRGRISISDRVGLEAVTCECYGIVRSSFDKLLGTHGCGEPSAQQKSDNGGKGGTT